MPPIFHLEAPVSPPKLDLSSASSQLFQVPSSASASSSLYHSISSSRKRARRNTDKLSSQFEPPSDLPSPSPHIQRDNRQTANDHHPPAELDFRPNRYRESFLPPSLGASVESVAPPEPTGSSRKRTRRDSCVAAPSADGSSPATPVGWGRTVINAVGKVLDLCWSGAFRGFYAGGGRGYEMTAGSAPQLDLSTWQPNSSPSAERDNTFSPHRPHLTPVPGQYPDDDIQRNWVVVPANSNDPFVGPADSSSPSFRARKFHQTSSPRRRPAATPRMGRRVVLSSARPSSPTKSPGLPSPRSRDGPASADAQRYAAQLRRKERQEDASIQRLNKQLQAMIREGKEALGTTVQVDDLDMEDYD